MEQEFNTQTHGKHHNTPSKDADIKLLESAYQASDTHRYIPGRKLKGSKRDRVQDTVTKGLEKLHTGQTLQRWQFGRNFPRSLDEIWEIVNDNAD